MGPTQYTIGDVLKSSTTYLIEIGLTEARVDAELLLADVMKLTRTDVMAHPENLLSEDEWLKFNRSVARRGEGREPVAYIVGRKEFYGVSLLVNRNVLIPRPETEILVERAIALKPNRVLDIGTGSGAIVAALKKHLPDATFVATDISKEAIYTAKRNVGMTVDWRVGPDFEPVKNEKFDLVVSNPPYISEADVEKLEPEVKNHEPKIALIGGPDGLEIVRRILRGAKAHAPKVLVEIGFGQAGTLRSEFPGVVFHRDLAGIERVAEL